MQFDWFPEKYGHKVLIDPYGEDFPTSSIVSCDIETNGKEMGDPDFKLVCIGISEDDNTAKVFFDLRPELFDYLRKTQLICHNAKIAEMEWLAPYGITMDQLFYDTKIALYVLNSAKKDTSLKGNLKEIFGIDYPTYLELIEDVEVIKASCEANPELLVKGKKGVTKLPKLLTLDKVPKEIVAAYNGLDCIYTYKLWVWLKQQFTAAQTNFLESIELPMTRLIWEMEKKGVKIDLKTIRRMHNEKSKERRKKRKELFNQAGSIFNPNSPKQVLPILQKAGANVNATSEDAIIRFKSIPFVSTLLEYRGLQKLCSTYTSPLYFEAVKKADNRIHAKFNQNTITGRLSSSDPINLQNQPASIREGFIADDGNLLIGSDWKNIELVLPAHLSGEPKFVNEFNKPGGDLHVVTANFLFGTNIRSLPEKEYKEKRQKAKTCNFLLTNSGSEQRLSAELQIELKEASELYKKFWEGYPVLQAWLKEEKKKARLNLGVTTMYGRWVSIPQLALWCGRSSCPVFGPNGYFCKQCFMREEAERSAMSVLVQGSAADMAKTAALRIRKEHGYAPILAVHDSFTYERPEATAAKDMEDIRYAMENVIQLKVPLRVDISMGKRWSEVK